MPKRVQLPNGQMAEFPDNMEDSAIEGVLRRQFPASGTQSATVPPLQRFLDSQPLRESVKADIWDHFHAATDPGDFKRRFDSSKVPRLHSRKDWVSDTRLGGLAPASGEEIPR